MRLLNRKEGVLICLVVAAPLVVLGFLDMNALLFFVAWILGLTLPFFVGIATILVLGWVFFGAKFLDEREENVEPRHRD